MELEELRNIWSQHEKMLVENTVLNRELLMKVLIKNTEKRIDWLKIRSLVGLILPFILTIFIVLPRIQYSLELDFLIGILLFVPLYILSYIWAIKLYIHIERLNPIGPVTTVSKQLKLIEKYKMMTTSYGYMLAPFMIIGIFLSAGMPFLSAKMIPFYTLMVISFLIGLYVRSKYGLVAQVRKIDQEIEEISRLEKDKEMEA